MKETESKGCCNDEQKILKIDKEQKIVYAAYQLPQFQPADIINAVLKLTTIYIVPSLKDEYAPGNSPPRWQNLYLFILNCVFRI